MLSVPAIRAIQFGALVALLAVAFGAFGAHALKEYLDAYSRGVFQTAVTYQMYHALALLSLGPLLALCGSHRAQWWLVLSRNAFLFGIVFFCGSLYLLSFSGLKAFGAITPIGGVAFLLGWVAMLVALTIQLKEQNVT